MFIKEENLFITTGIQQALFILSKLTFPIQKETILIELPSYHLMLDLLELEKIPFLTIERNENGLDWELLETYFRDNDIKFFYTTPRISSPLGLSFSEIEKKRLLKLANQYDIYLVEDDYLGDFISTTTNLPLHFYDTNERVIYLKSFSKIMFPGLRIGACLLPSVLREAFIKYRTILEVDSSMFSQAALNLYIKTGMFDEHIKDTRLIQLSRDQAFINQGKKTSELFDLSFFETGKSFITLPRDVSTSLFENYLQEENIKLEDIGRNVPNNYKCKNKIYTIELLQLTPTQITKGIAAIQNVYQKSKRKLSN
ncbi:PLP-dependent aminotransferase family protein [Vagococcus fluvialis]|nr:PLP-dependent aminotransferase family protein [Vagococcus fluvialis]NKD49455.1 PLP-dependent aminotransferase family protein [Vagococcus fluvialis]